jgi:hypothetical protein
MVGAILWGLEHEGAVDISVCLIDIDSPDVSNQLLDKRRPNLLCGQHGQYRQFTAKHMCDGV